MKIIVSPDSFKGSLSAQEAASAMREGISLSGMDAEIIEMPIADGGEGTLDVIEASLAGRMITKTVPGPDFCSVNAKYFISDEANTAYIELAQASGLMLIEEKHRLPMLTSTYGTGLLIADALEQGVDRICLTLGGSATNDGGAGIAKALGIRIMDQDGEEVAPNCLGLSRACSIDLSAMHPRLANVEIEIACDVKNPLCGGNGASYVYGPQKGATPAVVKEMDRILFRYGQLLESIAGRPLVLLPGSGAAGGAALPLLAFANARIISGIDMVLDAVDFDAKIVDADFVLTGEGKVDMQTGSGKAIDGIRRRICSREIPLIVFAGVVEKGAIAGEGVSLYCINPPGEKPEESLKRAYKNLRGTVANVIKSLIARH